MAKLGKANWLQEGFTILSEYNQAKIRILYLCERLGVTRGSFYHHFESIESYIGALMEAWEEGNTLALIRISNKGKTPLERMMFLNEEVEKADQRVEAAIRSWSFYNPVVKRHLDKVDKIRLAHLTSIFVETGLEEKMAQRKARLDYAVLVGIQQLFSDLSQADIQELYRVYLRQ